MNRLDELTAAVPREPDFRIDWEKIEGGVMLPFAGQMKSTNQNPKYHAEGNVWDHTVMVCEQLVLGPVFAGLPERQRRELFLAALFHDVGKIKTTRLENGEWRSPRHAESGSNTVREYLWREYGICGSPDLQGFRETVCLLVRHHMAVPHLIESDGAERKIIRIAANGRTVPDFSVKLLVGLSLADHDGKISFDDRTGRDNALLCAELAKELGCYEKPVDFTSDYTEYAYLSGRNVTPDTDLYDPSVCEAVIVCGLPGTGKDTYIKENYPDRPVVSLDDIREEKGISPVGSQKRVIVIAKDRLRALLRERSPLVFNATNVTPDIREEYMSLFCSYGAYVRMVFLETDYEENLKRNAERDAAVPVGVIERMLSKLVPPQRHEAHSVEWICI